MASAALLPSVIPLAISLKVTPTIGAFAGGVIGGVTYAIFHEGEWNWSQFGGSVAGCAVTGGIAGLTLGASLVATTGGALAVGAGGALAGYGTEVGTSELITGIWGEENVGAAKEWPWIEAGGSTLFGGITGLNLSSLAMFQGPGQNISKRGLQAHMVRLFDPNV
jgi:hypothetical protein